MRAAESDPHGKPQSAVTAAAKRQRYDRLATFYDLIDLPFEYHRYRTMRPQLFAGISPGNGARMDYAMAVGELLHRDGALQLDPATGHYPAHFPGV